MRNISTWVLFVLIYSCNSNHTIKESYNSEYEIENYNLIIDSLATFDFTLFQLVEDEYDEYLYVLNNQNKTIDIYDINKGKLTNRINMDKDQRFSKSSAHYFYVIDIDSILLIPPYSLRGTTLINPAGEVLHRYKAENPIDSENPNVLNHASNPSRPSYHRGGKLFLTNLTLQNTTLLKESNKEIYTDIIFDMDMDSVYFNKKVTYPVDYRKSSFINMHAINFRILTEKNMWVYSWPIMNELLVYDSAYNLTDEPDGKSYHYSGIASVPKEFPVERNLEHYISNTSYSRIIEDPIRELYYRFVIIGRKGFDPLNDLNLSSADKNDFSIIVFDKSFNKVKEVDFPGRKYNIYGAFVGKKGLFIPKTNYFNRDISEDTLKYDIINF